ncbi:MAG: cytidylate kinase-like family protein [Clostridia bacterium]|nr:cytidylate kinase-like family protein [Clostridia bacterium]
MSKIIVTIGRQYGSGGKEIGEKLAKKLDIPFYDNRLTETSAQDNQKPVNSLLYMLYTGEGTSETMPYNHTLFLDQYNEIKRIAQKGSCVFVGRCADYALRDEEKILNVFIHADIDSRIERVVRLYGFSQKHAKDYILKMDKQRANYYNSHTGRKWGSADNYDLVLCSSKLGIDTCVEIIKNCIELYK